jgi:hypothetical protein
MRLRDGGTLARRAHGLAANTPKSGLSMSIQATGIRRPRDLSAGSMRRRRLASRTASICSRPPAASTPALPRQESVESGAVLILGEVDDACVRIDRRGFMDEAAHRFERDRGDRRVGGSRHLETVAVRLRETCAAEGLLAGDPGTPGGGSARAVGDGAGQAHELADGKPRDRIDDDGRGPPAAHPVVLPRSRGEGKGDVPNLVIADDPQLSVDEEGRHAIGQARRGIAVAHRRAGTTEARIAESVRQREQQLAAVLAGPGMETAVRQRSGAGTTRQQTRRHCSDLLNHRASREHGGSRIPPGGMPHTSGWTCNLKVFVAIYTIDLYHHYFEILPCWSAAPSRPF